MNLGKIATIAWHEYTVNVRRIGFLVVTFLFPALGAVGLVVALFFSGQATSVIRSQLITEKKKTGIVDESRLFIPVRAPFDESFVVFTDESSAKQALLSNQIDAYAVVAANYMATGNVSVYSKGGITGLSNLNFSDLGTMFVQNLLAGKVDDKTLSRASDPINSTLITLDDKGNPTKGNTWSIVAGFVAPYIFSILLFIAVFSSSSYLLRSVADEKETRVIEIILSSVTPTELLAGKVIGLGALGLTQVGVWLSSSFLLSGGLGAIIAGAVLVLNPANFLLAVIYFLLGYLLFGVIMATAGALGSNPRESQQIAGIFSMIASLPMFFASVLFANPNSTIARVLSYFPLTAPTTMMLRLPLTEVPFIDIVISLVVLVVSIPIVLWAGARIFRIGLLMYGKRPSIKEIIGALRQA